MNTAFANLVAASLKTERFTLVDLGCSGGIEPVWRLFGDRFRAVGFDASVAECRRLAAAETNSNVRYVPGFIDIPPQHPFAKYSEGKPSMAHNSFPRSSAAWALEMRAERLKSASLHEKLQHNAWDLTKLADRDKPIFVPDVLREIRYDDVDLLKLDIDGPDYRVLNSLDSALDELGLLAARLEVNMYGGTGDTLHTFNNTDRFMREQGFELVALESRCYSMRALPSTFAITMPAQTTTGRIFQAEAFYARDPAGADWSALAATMRPEKLLKLAAIFSIWNQPDGAAEILLSFREKLSPVLDIDAALDLLAAQSQPDTATPLSYRDYVALFGAESPRFYPPPPPPAPTLRQRLAAAWRAYVSPNEAFSPRRQ